jgi:hypothetical protein
MAEVVITCGKDEKLIGMKGIQLELCEADSLECAIQIEPSNAR